MTPKSLALNSKMGGVTTPAMKSKIASPKANPLAQFPTPQKPMNAQNRAMQAAMDKNNKVQTLYGKGVGY